MTLASRSTSIDINPSDSVYYLKETYKGIAGEDPESIKLIYRGREMDDDEPLTSYGITEGGRVTVINRIRGGARVDRVIPNPNPGPPRAHPNRKERHAGAA
jgi:Ubiquitin family